MSECMEIDTVRKPIYKWNWNKSIPEKTCWEWVKILEKQATLFSEAEWWTCKVKRP